MKVTLRVASGRKAERRRKSPLIVTVALFIVRAGSSPVHAQESNGCMFLCAPELKIEPTFTVETPLSTAEDRRAGRWHSYRHDQG